jgi:hypothetical protein
MTREVYHNRRALLVLFLLCLTFYAQSASLLDPIQPHHAGHCCLLCHVGSLPFLEVATSSSAAPIGLMERLVPNSELQSTHDVQLNANSSRAPPA